ncbi:MAG: ThuA domain-containing protein [Verrucomicrobiales bacterium]|nr:ThuA domain-containing protein [Verrucomicrobiales bacterium]
MTRRTLLASASLAVLAAAGLRAEESFLVFAGGNGPGKGKHVVLLSGDEEYRSEESMPMLGRLLAERHGFKTTVCFSIGADGSIDPNNGASLSGSEALESADAIVMALRFRHWDDQAMERFEKAFLAGKPIIALRTSTHAFNFGKDSKWHRYTWNNSEGGFGRRVLGETWVSHWGNHKNEATKGIIEIGSKASPLLRGVDAIFGDTDVYEAAPPADATILVRGQVLKGMKPDDPPAEPREKKTAKGQKTGINDPMMPVAWTREYKNEAGTTNKILCTTMGSATDLANEGLRRLVVNGVFWGLNLEVPAKANATPCGDYSPTMYGFGGFKKGVKPASLK